VDEEEEGGEKRRERGRGRQNEISTHFSSAFFTQLR
jgi:hypothetical protein